MESSMESPRQHGIQALRAGRLDEAIDLLTGAVTADSRDAEAQAFLGVAYCEKGLHARARQALLNAVALAPRNHHYRFNLGVALERAGDGAGAAQAYRETLAIHPEHAHARARLQGLGAVAEDVADRAPAPPAPAGGARTAEAPWLRGQSPGTAPQAGLAERDDRSSPAGGGPGRQPLPSARPPGSVQCPRCHEWQKPGLSCEFCSAALPGAARMATGPARLTGRRPSPELPGSAARWDADQESFSLVQGLKDWGRVLVAPQSFFRDQEGRTGMAAPLAILLVYAAAMLLAFGPLGFGMVSLALRGPTAAGSILLLGLGVGVLIAAGVSLVLLFAWTGIVHLVCKLLRGEAGYAGSFRAVSYSGAPMALAYALTSLIAAGIAVPMLAGLSGGTAPRLAPRSFGGASLLIQGLTLVGLVYAVILLGIGTFYIHRLNPGAAAAAAVLAVGVGWGSLFLLTRPLAAGLNARNAMLGGRGSTAAAGPRVGQRAPDFTLVNTAGQPVRLAGLRGKVVFVNFWASWCGPCRAEAPHLEALSRKYRRQGLVILGLSTDRDRGAATEFARRTWSYPVLLDAGAVARQYGVMSIPCTFVIGKDGRVTARHDGYGRGMERRLEDEVKTLLRRALAPPLRRPRERAPRTARSPLDSQSPA